METPLHPPESPELALDDTQANLLRVARLLYLAAGAAEQVTVSTSLDLSLDDRLAEFDVKILLWQTVALLPPGLRLDREEPQQQGTDPSDDLRSKLQSASRVLSRVSLADLPAGTSGLLTDLTALISRIGATPRGRSGDSELV